MSDVERGLGERTPSGASGLRRRGEMPLSSHLKELRARFGRSALALLIGAVAGYAVFPVGIDLLLSPYCEAVGATDSCDLVVLSPLDPFFVRLRTAFVVGLVVGAPVFLYQAWRFVRPGLTRRERRYLLPFVLLSQVMFAGGIAFASWVIPRGLGILLELGGDGISPLLGAREYLAFLLTMGLAFGIVFELPLVLAFLVLTGVLTARGMRDFRRYAVVINVIAAALITPTGDAVTLLFVAGPMLLFYELAIAFAWLVERSRRRQAG